MKNIKKEINKDEIKLNLLGLTSEEKQELASIKEDYMFYHGAFTSEQVKAYTDKTNKRMLGQSWFIEDNLDYIPSQVIDNITQELIKKQARFFLGKAPDLLFKLNDNNIGGNSKGEKEKLEQFRLFIDSILDSNSFWPNMLKNFKLASITRKILIRLEANEGEPVKIHSHDVCDFNYTLDSQGDLDTLKLVTYIGYDQEQKEHIFARYTYYLESNIDGSDKCCMLLKEHFYSNDTQNPIGGEQIPQRTIYDRIPAVLFFNERDLFNPNGVSDIQQLKSLQDQYNRRLSDFADALRFNMFGATTIIDGDPEDVNNITVAPGSIIAIGTESQAKDDGRQAQVKIVESNFTNAEPVKEFLDSLRNSMGDKLAIPRKDALKEIPSAKALKFIYNDLIARCEEKWQDWESGIFKLINLIIQSCDQLHCYDDFDKSFLNLEFSMILKKNYPIPDDEEDAKRLAMEEVAADVRSHRSYIKDYGSDEDYEELFREIIEDNQMINESTMDPISRQLSKEQNTNLEE